MLLNLQLYIRQPLLLQLLFLFLQNLLLFLLLRTLLLLFRRRLLPLPLRLLLLLLLWLLLLLALLLLFVWRYSPCWCDILLESGESSQLSPLLTTSAHSLKPLEVWPDLSATAASLSAANLGVTGAAGVAGFGTGFFPGPPFDKCPAAPQDQQLGGDSLL